MTGGEKKAKERKVNERKAAESRAAGAETEKAYDGWIEMKITDRYDERVEELMTYKKEVNERQAARKLLHPEVVEAKKQAEAKKHEDEFKQKEDAFRESMDGMITPPRQASTTENSLLSPPSIYATPPEEPEPAADSIQELGPLPNRPDRQNSPMKRVESHPIQIGQIGQGLSVAVADRPQTRPPQDAQISENERTEEVSQVSVLQSGQDPPVEVVDELPQLPMRQDGRESLNDELEELSPVPLYRKLTYEDLKLTSVQDSPVASLHTGAQLHVHRVPTEDIPSSLGTSVMGLHPHASVWTKSPAWAQTIVAVGIGAALTGIGFGLYKLFRKITHKTTNNGMETQRLHARDWNIKSRQMKKLIS